jgi:hypothetical protein
MRTRLAFATVLSLAAAVSAQTPAKPASKGTSMTQHAKGTFDVNVQPLPADEKVPGLTVARFAWNKQWKGDFEGSSKGEMMASNSGDQGSGGYVAIEQVTGKLGNRAGSFTVVHKGTMKGGSFELAIDVVPDSATGQLAGLSGRVTIVIADGKHSYDIEYTLPDAP